MNHRDEVFATGIAVIELCILTVQVAHGDTPEQLRAAILKIMNEMLSATKKRLVS